MLVLFSIIFGMSFVMSVTNLEYFCCEEAPKSSMTSRTEFVIDHVSYDKKLYNLFLRPKKPAKALASLAAVRGFGGQRPF